MGILDELLGKPPEVIPTTTISFKHDSDTIRAVIKDTEFGTSVTVWPRRTLKANDSSITTLARYLLNFVPKDTQLKFGDYDLIDFGKASSSVVMMKKAIEHQYRLMGLLTIDE